MVPRVGNETLRPLGDTMGTPPAWLVPEETYEKTPSVGRRQPMTSLPARPQYKDGRANTSSASSSEACVRSMAPKPRGRSGLVPHSGNHGYIRNLRRSPSWELRTASPRGHYGERYIPTPPCWGECKPNSRRRRAQVNSTIWLRELPLFWTVDAVSDIILLWPKTRAAYLKYLPARCRHYRTQGRAHRFGIILIQKDSFKGIGPST